MKPHRILKSFKGSQTGNDHHHFEAGTVQPLTDDLAAIVTKEGWAEPHTDSGAEDRETKVVEPDELKDEPKKAKKAKA